MIDKLLTNLHPAINKDPLASPAINIVGNDAKIIINPRDIQIVGSTTNALTPFLEGWTLYNKATMLANFVNRAQSGITNFVNRAQSGTTNFVGKIAGSAIENPNIIRQNSIASPNTFPLSSYLAGAERSHAEYGNVATLDGKYMSRTAPTNGLSVAHTFSFDAVAYVERRHGVSIGVDTAAKIAWLKANITAATFNFWGYGSSPTGYKASVSMWDGVSAWVSAGNSTASTVTKQTYTYTQAQMSRIDANGMISFLAYAEASNGTVDSVLNTDYVELYLEYVTPFINANKSYRVAIKTAPEPPTGTWVELVSQGAQGYSSISALDSSLFIQTTSAVGTIAQQLLSFDLISYMYNKHGIVVDAPWLKANVTSLTGNWWGFGSGPAGNKAQGYMWNAVASSWGAWANHTNGVVTKIVIGTTNPVNYIDANGFFNILLASDPSDGTIASSINTDYAELAIEYIAPFLNPNSIRETGASTLTSPLALLSTAELNYTKQSKIIALDGNSASTTTTTVGNTAQQDLYFDLISITERKYNITIPGATTADKVTWLKANVTNITCNCYSFGSSPLGNKAYLAMWHPTNLNWSTFIVNNTASTITKNQITTANATAWIDASGFVYFNAYADPAGTATNPTVAPTLSTSGSGSGLAAGTYYVKYVWTVTGVGPTLPSPEQNITITAGQNLIVSVPSLPFGVTYADIYISTSSGTETYQGGTISGTYTRTTALSAGIGLPSTNTAIVASTINTDYAELIVEANVVSGVTKSDFQIDPANPYGLILDATELSINKFSNVDVPVTPNSLYTFSVSGSGAGAKFDIDLFDASNVYLGGLPFSQSAEGNQVQAFTTPSNAVKARVNLYAVLSGLIKFNNPQLQLGPATPFIARGDSAQFNLVAHTLGSLTTEINKLRGLTATCLAPPTLGALTLVSGTYMTPTNLNLFTSLLWQLLKPVAIALLDALDAENSAVQEMIINTSDGAWLDSFGDFFGILRETGEPDSLYATRVFNLSFGSRTNNIAIQKALKDVLYECEVKDSTGPTFDILPAGSSSVGFQYSPDQIHNIIDQLRPAGVSYQIRITNSYPELGSMLKDAVTSTKETATAIKYGTAGRKWGRFLYGAF